MSAPKKNNFAAKASANLASTHLHIRIRKADKARWKDAAALRAGRDLEMNGKLTCWVVDVLNAEADYEKKNTNK